jgi:hypothetical protein
MKKFASVTFFVFATTVFAQMSRVYSEPAVMCEIQDKQVNESSGIAVSTLTKGVYFTHNDSGDGPRFFRFDRTGSITGIFRLRDAKALDWEDMDSALIKGKSYLYLGDIGDNASKRNSITIYRVLEPTGSSKDLSCEAFEVVYPDGPRNAESLLVEPKTGFIQIVSKTDKGRSSVYRLELKKSDKPLKMTKLGEFQLPAMFDAEKLTTGGSFSPDGKFVAIRGYTRAWEFEVRDLKTWFTSKPKSIPVPLVQQAEAIAYERDGKSILTTSEGTPCPVHRISLKK